MWLLSLAWKNIWRNKSRTAITMSAVFFAVLLSVFAGSLKSGIFGNMIKNVVSFYTGYIQVHKIGYWDEQVLDNGLNRAEERGQDLISLPNIKGFAPRLETFALIAAGMNTKGCMVAGIDPERENKVTALRSKLIRGRYLEAADSEALIAEGLASRLKVGLQDTIFIIGQGYHGATAAGRFRVKGIVKFGSPELNNQILFISMPAAAELFSAEGIATSLVVSLENPALLNESVQAIAGKAGPDVEVMSWETMMPDVKQHIETDSNNMKYVQGILYMLVSFGIFGTFLMMMVERRFELAMLIAIGMKKSKLCLLMVFESVFTVLGGCLLGILISIPVVYYFNRKPMKLGGEIASIYEKFGFEAIFPTSMNPDNFVFQGITVLIIGLVLALYPVYKVIKTNPGTSLKR